MNLFKNLAILLFSIASLTLSCKNHSTEKSKDEIISVDSNAAVLYPSEAENDSMKVNDAMKTTDSVKVSVKTFQENSQWGYDIFVNDKLYIHQPTAPSVPGNSGFKTEEDAKKTGEFVAYKIKHHIMPPSVTPEELDSLGTIKK